MFAHIKHIARTNILETLRSYWIQKAGAIAVAFAVMAPVLVGSTGMALDLGQSFLVRQRLAGALDAAALAATAAEATEAEIKLRIDDFMAANYPTGKIGSLIISSITVSVVGDDVTVSASAEYDTKFMKILGIDQLNVHATTTIHRAIKGLEAVLVLDNTGSMGNTNIAHLQTASKNFVQILFDRAQDPNDIKIGIVPYAAGVRVGFYGLGYYPDDTEFDANGFNGTYVQYGSGTKFINYPPNGVDPFSGGTPDTIYVTRSDRSAGGTGDNGWYGCVVEHKDSNYNASATHVPGSHGQLWSTHATVGQCSAQSTCRGHGWDPGSSSNDPYDDDVNDDWPGPWDIYMYGEVITAPTECTDLGGSYSNSSSRCSDCTGSGGNCASDYCYCMHYQPARSCPWAYIQPMISDESALNAHIDTMNDDGNTYSNLGMLWGMRLISPDPPFIEGSAWDDEQWNKAIIMMTDGDMVAGSTYSGYWDSDRTAVDSDTDLENRFQEVCTFLKNQGVVVYTVTFEHASANISNATKQIYKDCATQPWEDYYADVSTGAELNTLFEEIAAALSRLHISN